MYGHVLRRITHNICAMRLAFPTKRILLSTGAVTQGPEYNAMSKVLDAAALTYVAAFLSALASFLQYLLPLLMGGRDEEE